MRRAPSIAVLLIAAACSHPTSVASTAPTTASVSIAARGGPIDLDFLGLADSPDERAHGLMGRTDLGADDGMLFVFQEPWSGAFWMKDTLIPLSIAFWDEGGRIISILDMAPCIEDPCPTFGPDQPFVGAVEVDRGAFERHGVVLGDTVELTLSNG